MFFFKFFPNVCYTRIGGNVSTGAMHARGCIETCRKAAYLAMRSAM